LLENDQFVSFQVVRNLHQNA